MHPEVESTQRLGALSERWTAAGVTGSHISSARGAGWFGAQLLPFLDLRFFQRREVVTTKPTFGTHMFYRQVQNSKPLVYANWKQAEPSPVNGK